MSPGEQTPDRGTFRCTLQVRWADFDQYGHVNNIKYLEYAQEARILFIRSRFGPFGLGNLPQVVRRTEIDHLRPVLRDSTSVDVEIDVEHVGTTSYQIRQTILDAAGEIGPSLGWFQRSRASTLCTRPVRMRTWGW